MKFFETFNINYYIALIKIHQKDDTFIGWFFKHTDELNLYSNKIYEITLKECIIEN